ncbi:PREDICTED: adenosine 3'-phospho 5'-phosphosulfate transporter 1-like isoform X2 [Amphimedon queenslandica]|uniref:Adenosine 3'-phospho 5'-phosphosulfate transporter 1 n=1 Tax=Amphimedon queenslandica TaxID=400682 RepID=A0A1X7VCV4_AMPQE|nr:PREDICTED: adenosine 3'-phospho 5'-phosphosulfate transporter 1-like isoform X2 [Amphimedon queenslandica]|eukprot:XP_019849584.1 PREDICTED: adenosine 3'-phospho 5'-phosphosulfate transporter 1-like isoform X2 [Amphimedon queenslandica]
MTELLLREETSYSWLVGLFLNIFGCAVIILPATLLIRYLKDSEKVKRGSGSFYSLIRLCVLGSGQDTELERLEEGKEKVEASTEAAATPLSQYCTKLFVCILGLQFSFLVWGLLQERIMTRSYDGDTFSNSQFLVFTNRILSLITSAIYISFTKQPPHTAPLYKYSFSSFSNILSSWCQYEALKYVSFPTQILSKSSKVIPVMLMGKIISNKVYPWYDYLVAVFVSIGVTIFLLATKTHSGVARDTTCAGLFILLCYMIFDSFTSNWQSKLFVQYKMSSFQMMFGINIFSSLLALVSLITAGTLFTSLEFFLSHPLFAAHAVILSICSAVVTSRQVFSILLSCFVYGHRLTLMAVVGISIVFLSLLSKALLHHRNKKRVK